MIIRKQNSTDYQVRFFMADEADPLAGKTGLTPTLEVCKPGGAFAAAAGAVTEVGNGWYDWAGNATDRNALGENVIEATAAGAVTWRERMMIVYHDPVQIAEPGDQMDLVNAQNATAISAIITAIGAMTADGVALTKIMEVLMAAIIGKASVADNVITFKKRDGTTTSVTVTVDDEAADGSRTASVIA